MKYLFIDEDCGLSQADTMLPEVIQACDDGIWAAVNMETNEHYIGDGKWESIPIVNPADYILGD